MNPTNHPLQRAALLALFVVFALSLAGCRSSRSAVDEGTYLSSKVKLSLPHKDGHLTVNGSLKLVGGQRMQLTMLMPVIRSEILRIEVTPDTLLIVDRIDRLYMQASRRELKAYLPRKADFDHLERLLLRAAKSKEATVDLGDLGLPKVKDCWLTLSDFSTKPLQLEGTKLSAKYKQVEPEELIELIQSLFD